jgi:hypothetical protein
MFQQRSQIPQFPPITQSQLIRRRRFIADELVQTVRKMLAVATKERIVRRVIRTCPNLVSIYDVFFFFFFFSF